MASATLCFVINNPILDALCTASSVKRTTTDPGLMKSICAPLMKPYQRPGTHTRTSVREAGAVLMAHKTPYRTFSQSFCLQFTNRSETWQASRQPTAFPSENSKHFNPHSTHFSAQCDEFENFRDVMTEHLVGYRNDTQETGLGPYFFKWRRLRV